MAHSRTIISLPGSHARPNGAKSEPLSETLRDNKSIRLQGRMIVGILYSVSRNLLGEIFPIYVGKNIIGSSPDSDVCLREASVYPSHAILLVRKITDDNGVTHTTVSITEESPGAGTSVNGDILEYERVYCKDGDIINIGSSYSLSLQLLSPDTSGLGVSPDFDALPEVQTAREQDAFIDAGNPYASMYNPVPSYRDSIGEDDERSFYAPSKAKETDHLATKTVVENK